MKTLIIGCLASTALLLPLTAAMADDGDAHKVLMTPVYRQATPPQDQGVQYLSNEPNGNKVIHHRKHKVVPEQQ
jgi:hypothetical protein